jgi:hypothetical protein
MAELADASLKTAGWKTVSIQVPYPQIYLLFANTSLLLLILEL